MTICKIRPDYNNCCSCIDKQVRIGVNYKCEECAYTSSTWFQLIKVKKSFLGKTYGIVLRYNHIEKIPLRRIFDVREVREPWEELNKENSKEEIESKVEKEKF